MSEVDSDILRAWVGKAETRVDVIAPAPISGLAATLGGTPAVVDAGEAVPTGGHWLYFLDAITASEIDRDGHEQRGGFMPPVPLPR